MRYTCSPSSRWKRTLSPRADRRFARRPRAQSELLQQALLNHSLALCELGRPEEALAQCERALRLGGDATRGHALRCDALGALKRGPERACQLRSGDRAARPRPGTSLQPRQPPAGLERFEEAVASYDAALAIAAEHLGAINNRGTALRDLGRYEEALKSYDRVLEYRS